MKAALLLLLFDSLLEMYRLTGVLVLFAFGKVMYLGIDKRKEVQQCHNRQYHACPIARRKGGDNFNGKENAVNNGQPFHLNGNDEEQQHLRVGEQQGKGQEHGQVHIFRADNGKIGAGDQGGEHRADDGQQYAAEVVQIKLRRAPLALQRRADPVVKIQRNQQHKGAGGVRHKDEGDDAPNFAVQQSVKMKGEKIQCIGIGIAGEHHEKIDEHITDDNIAHQIGHTKARMAGTEAIHRFVDFFQGRIPPIVQLPRIILPDRGKFMNK